MSTIKEFVPHGTKLLVSSCKISRFEHVKGGYLPSTKGSKLYRTFAYTGIVSWGPIKDYSLYRSSRCVSRYRKPLKRISINTTSTALMWKPVYKAPVVEWLLFYEVKQWRARLVPGWMANCDIFLFLRILCRIIQ